MNFKKLYAVIFCSMITVQLYGSKATDAVKSVRDEIWDVLQIAAIAVLSITAAVMIIKSIISGIADLNSGRGEAWKHFAFAFAYGAIAALAIVLVNAGIDAITAESITDLP